ncbi:hypothetical protein BC833DRAFT_591967, partial [Globomyces pollinis-pini]
MTSDSCQTSMDPTHIGYPSPLSNDGRTTDGRSTSQSPTTPNPQSVLKSDFDTILLQQGDRGERLLQNAADRVFEAYN